MVVDANANDEAVEPDPRGWSVASGGSPNRLVDCVGRGCKLSPSREHGLHNVYRRGERGRREGNATQVIIKSFSLDAPIRRKLPLKAAANRSPKSCVGESSCGLSMRSCGYGRGWGRGMGKIKNRLCSLGRKVARNDCSRSGGSDRGREESRPRSGTRDRPS